MTGVVKVSLEEAEQDLRSRQVTLRLTVRNTGATSITILGISQIAPRGIKFEKSRNISALAQIGDEEEKCRRAEYAFIDYLASAWSGLMPSVGDPAVDGDRLDPRQIIDMFRVNARYLLSWWSLGLTDRVRTRRKAKAMRRLARSHVPHFISLGQAVAFGEELLRVNPPSGAEPLRASCRSLVSHLRKVAEHNAADLDHEARIPPEGDYSRPFVAKCTRGFFNWRRYTVSLQVRYTTEQVNITSPSQGPAMGQAGPDALPSLEGVVGTCPVNISPQPFGATVVAVAAGVIGAVLHGWAEQSALGPSTSPIDDPVRAGLAFMHTRTGVTAMLLAATFFNVFEYTALRGRLGRWVDWRGALMIGLLCGLGTTPILAEIQRAVPEIPIVQRSSGASPTSRPFPDGLATLPMAAPTSERSTMPTTLEPTQSADNGHR